MAEEHNKTSEDVVDAQLGFFRKGGSGCAFAALAARNPEYYEWHHIVIRHDEYANIQGIIASAIANEAISTLALVLPDVDSEQKLDAFLPSLNGEILFLHHTLETDGNRCFRFRARVGEDESYVSGFGPFQAMPLTRRTPHTALVFRVGPRPKYDWHLKVPVEGLIHVADMDMKGVPDRTLHRMWRSSFLATAGILTKEPDEESAAKTTFVIPLDRADQISIESLE